MGYWWRERSGRGDEMKVWLAVMAAIGGAFVLGFVARLAIEWMR